MEEPQKNDDVDIISTLPTENGWLSDDTHPLYYYQGFWYYRRYVRGVLAIAAGDVAHFNPSPSDTIVCSTPRSGTTWLKALTYAVTTRSRFAARLEDNPLHSTFPHDLIPLIEVHVAQLRKPGEPDLPLFATHLPYAALPDSIPRSGCKIVYLWRDPKDAFVSRWLFAHQMRPDRDVTKPIPLEEAFDLFCRGVSPYGSYWDHVLGYWKACLDRPDKILFLKYEDMMDDVEANVKRLAGFMGYPFSMEEEEEKEGVLTRIVQLCSFESLSSINKGGNFFSKGSMTITKDSFFRKGKVGDWKNYLTDEMAAKMDQITLEKLGNVGLI